MAGVAKWLRQWFVVPPFVGSSPIVRPLLYLETAVSILGMLVFWLNILLIL